MRRIRNSVKAIIISICLVVVFAGTILGVILVNKNKNNNHGNGGNGGVEPFVNTLTEDQIKLGGAINDSIDKGLNYAPKYEYSNFYFEDGTQVNFDLVEAIYENYFTYKQTNSKFVYIKTNESDGRVYFKDLFDILDKIIDFDIASVMEVKNNYAFCVYASEVSGEYIAQRIVVDFNDVENVSIIKSFEIRANTLNDLSQDLAFNTNITLKENYFANIEKKSNETYDIQVYDYAGNLINSISNCLSFDERKFDDNYFYYVIGNDVCISSYIDGEFKVYNLEEDNENLYTYTVSVNYVFIEKVSLASVEDENAVDGKIYSYSILDMKTGNIQDFDLEDGYVKATFSSDGINGYYYVYMQKPNESKDDFETNGLMVYYDSNKIVLKYLTNSIKDKVIYIAKNNFVTKYAIYTTEYSILASKIYSFENSGSFDETVNNETFIGFDGRIYYIYNINGSKVFEKSFGSICSYGNGIYFASSREKIYYININLGLVEEIVNFLHDEEKYNQICILYGGGYYFEKNDTNNKYSMFDYKRNLIYDNVVSFDIISKNTSYVNVVFDNGKNTSIVLDANISINNENIGTEPVNLYNRSESVTNNSVENYGYSKSGTDWDASGCTDKEGSDAGYSWAYCNGKNGMYIKSARAEFGGSAFVGSWFGDSYASFSYNYDNGTVTMSDYSSVTGSYSHYASVDESTETHTIYFSVYFTYHIWPGDPWNSGVGDFAGLGSVETAQVYCDVDDYILPVTTDVDYNKNAAYYVFNDTDSLTYSSDDFSILNQTCLGGRTTGKYTGLSSDPPSSWTGVYNVGDNDLDDKYFYKSSKKVVWRTYAIYEPNTYSITYDLNDGDKDDASHGTTPPSTAIYNVEFSVSHPSRPGYTFVGWTVDSGTTKHKGQNDTKFIKLTPTHQGSVTLKAQWVENSYYIRLHFGKDIGTTADIFLETQFDKDYTLSTGSAPTAYTPGNPIKSFSSFNDVRKENSVIITDPNGNFIGKYDDGSTNGLKTTAGNDVQTLSLEGVVSFTYTKYNNIGAMYEDLKVLNPEEDDYKVSTLGIQYNIIGWAILLDDKKELHKIDNNTSLSIIDYLKVRDKNADHSADSPAYIDLYAVYEPKPYIVYKATDTQFGKGSLIADDNIHSLDLDQKSSNLIWTYQLDGDDSPTSWSSTSIERSSNRLTITIEINNKAADDTDAFKDYYIFDRIELLNLGYKSGNNFYYGNVILTWNGNNFVPTADKRGSQYALPSNAVYRNGNTQGVYTYANGADDSLKYYSSGAYKGYYFYDENQNGINGFKVSTNADKGKGTTIILEFVNLGYAGNEKDNNASNNDGDGNGCADYRISSESVNGRGKYGLTIKACVKSNYKTADEIQTNWEGKINDNVNIESNKTFVNNTNLTTTQNYFMMTNVVSLNSGLLTLYTDTGSSISVKYFWLNGIKYVLKNTKGEYVTTANLSDRGYYKLGTAYLKWTPEEKSLFYMQYGGEYFLAKTATRIADIELSNAWTDKTIIYYDGSRIYYLSNYNYDGESRKYNNVSYNNNQVIAIAPQQTLTKFSVSPSDSKYDDNATDPKIRYELDYYLKSINIGGSGDITLHAGGLKNYNDDYGTYDKFLPLSDSLEAVTSADVIGKNISYLGEEYRIKYSYIIEVDSRTYALYFTVREKDNYVMYFLYSNVGSASTSTNDGLLIMLKYERLQLKVNVNVTDVEDDKGFSSTPNNATINYYNTTISSAAEFTTKDYDYDNFKQSYEGSMYPSEIRIIKITPIKGYLINSISVNLGSNNLMNFSLYYIGLNSRQDTDHPSNDNNVSYFSYAYTVTEGAEAVTRYLVKYQASENKVFEVDKFGSQTPYYYSGIFFSETQATAWNTKKSKNIKDANNTPAFESIFILVSGVYHDVTIDVETTSFIEFDFENENNVLDKKPADRYDLNGVNFNKVLEGQYYIQFKEIDPTGLVKYKRTDIITDILGDDGHYYRAGTGADCYFVTESNGGNSFLCLLEKQVSNYIASTSGTYIVEKQQEVYGSNGSNFYNPFLEREESIIDNNISPSYLLSDIKNLSIIVNDGTNDIKIGSQNILDCDNPDTLLEASLVKDYGNILRVLFIGKSEYFKYGVKILASGSDYSVYFTGGRAYNDDGNDVNGLSIFRYIDEAEGRKDLVEGDVIAEELDIQYEGTSSNNLNLSDKLTYIQIDNIRNFFDKTIYNRDRSKLEFSKKYFLYLKAYENNISLNVNSYLSNNSSKLLDGTVTELGPNYNKTYYDAYSSHYTTSDVPDTAADAENKMVSALNSTNKQVIKSDSRNILSGFSTTVSNEVNASTYSPFMWIGNQLYQLDYVDNAAGRYFKQQSWFNDTVLTNIDYLYKNNQDSTVFGINATGNWQNINKSTSPSAGTYNAVNNPKISGYQIEYTYNLIPGYYLEYIVIETVDYGLFYIYLGDSNFNDNIHYGQIKYNNSKIDTKIHYSIEFVTVMDGDDLTFDSKYIIKFYDTQENDYHGKNALNSIGILSNNISINFYSRAYPIYINYKTNAENPDDAANHSYISSTPTCEANDDPLYYDTLEVLDAFATMEGYSFIGWGSKNYLVDANNNISAERFDKVNLTWNSSSVWKPIKKGENSNPSSINYFKASNRNDLFNLGDYPYEVYIKSSHPDRKDSTGYFVTDTGNAFHSINQENYNFWAAYASIFKSSMKLRYPTGADVIHKIASDKYQGSKYAIDLYAIWKANVYAVELNFNDADKKSVNDNTKNNGSTRAELALARSSSYSHYVWNNTTYDSKLNQYLLGNLSSANKIARTVSHNGNPTSETDNYYCYVTFDKNDWYVVSANANKDLVTELYSTGSYSSSTTSPFVNMGGGKNQLDFVIDRYGYSWLGWFSEKLANTYENNFTNSNEIVFGSDYYYTKTGDDNKDRPMPYLRGWVVGENHGEIYVSIDEYETLVDGSECSDKNTTAYSEVVYMGQEYFKNANEYYVYHYDYMSNFDSHYGFYSNVDFLNAVSRYKNYLTVSADSKGIFTYYDTSLTLDSYDKYYDIDDNKWKLTVTGDKISINKERGEEGGANANYRYITLYAYWLVNDYNVIIDYRDNEENDTDDCDSIYEIGSTAVTNKAEIESDYDINDVDGSGDKYNIRNTYFDDEGYAYVLNTAIPNRVGYDFVGWSFFFRNHNIPTIVETESGFYKGDLYNYNGLQTASGSYVLSLTTIQHKYYHTAINVDVDAKYTDVIALYNEEETPYNRLGLNYNYDYYLSQLNSNGYEQLHKLDSEATQDWKKYNNEYYGDNEADGDRFIYIFAMWRAQTFTIDVDLNIDTDDLINGYDQDSAYFVGFYDSYNAAGDLEVHEKGFVGINSLFVRQKPNQDNIDNYGDVFTEIVANLTFVIYFDEPFSNAMFTDPNAAEVKYYYLADLFAVSTGYYLINWLYDSDDPNAKLISNSLRSEYGYYSNLVNKREDGGERTSKDALKHVLFDLEFYRKLYNTNYKNMTGVSILNGNGLPIAGSKFEENNTNKLADSETSLTTLTDGNNASFASSNFGYLVVDGKKRYIQPEFIDTGLDGHTDSYNLYYTYNGVKYYVLFYEILDDGTRLILTNDLSYLYYQPKGKTNKYVIRYDSDGNAYYVPNDGTYSAKDQVNLQVAVFDNVEFTTSDDISTYIANHDKYSDAGHKISSFTPLTTRQFTVYAHWEIKDDLYVSYNNGNSGQDEIVSGEPTGNVLKSNISNPGLAGFYASYLNGSNNPTLITDNKVSAGGASYMMGYDIDSIKHNYETYNDFGFDVIPFLNGRYISEVAIEFDRLEAVSSTSVTAVHQKVKYKLTIAFEWVNNADIAENIIKVTEIKLWRYDPELTTKKHCSTCVADFDVAELVSGTCPNCGGSVSDKKVGGYKTNYELVVALKTNSQVVSINHDDENAQNLYSYLSVLSHVSFKEGLTLFDISDYGTDAGGSNVLAMRDGTPFNRRDVNMLRFNFTDLLTSVYVTCKFSVQTYDLKVHHLFDENGDTFIQSTTDRSSYTSQYTEIIPDEHYETKDSLDSANVWTDTTPTGKNQALATIPVKLDLDSTASMYNIPYGYFLYGSYYDSALVGYRPMDDYYGVGANNGFSYKGDLAHKTNITYLAADGVTPLVEEVSFDGFNFIYSEGNYTKGRGGTGLLLDGDGGDAYVDQGSPLLGSSVNFPTKSIRFNKSFYLFKGWYEIDGKNGGYIVFNAYNDVDEATYINRNIVLYGYYYSNNTPTNIQFYTWNNEWNENSPAYLPYTNNADEYTLSSSDEMSPFIVDGGYLAPSPNAVNYVDEFGRMILKSNVEYGVDSSRFSLDEFTGYELSNSNPADISLLNNILKTYWYYEETYKVLYAKNLDGEEVAYIKYDPEIWSEYEFIQLAGGVNGMIVNTSQYEQYLKDGITEFEILARTAIEGDSGTATITDGEITVDVEYDSVFAKYYFYNEATGKYYFFSKDLKNTVMTKRIKKKKAFYYEYGANQIREVKVNSSDDMGNTKLYIYNDETGEFDIERPLEQESIYTYGHKFIGAELYAMIGTGSSAKYYKYHKVPEELIDNAAAGSFIEKYEPRYYVDISGTRYYTMIHKNKDKGTHNDDKKFTDLFTEEGVKASAITFNITTLNNYYVLLDDIYYRINYKEIVDAMGSVYINPMQLESTVTLPYGDSNVEFYFDYSNNSNTSGLYEKYESNDYEDAVLFNYRIYTPISKNYSLNAVLKNNVWISSDITLNAFPSLNMDYWYNNPDYILLGYLNVSNIDIEIMKRNEDEGAIYENSQFSYVPALNQIVNTDEYKANSTPGAYTVFATLDWFNNRLTVADSGHVLSVYHDTDIDKYYFLYNSDDGSMVYYYFANNEENVVQIMHEQGGQLFNAYADYIDNKYAGDAYSDLRDALKEAVAGKAREFGLSELLRAPMFVDSYQLSSIDHKTIERVVMRISSQFVFTWAEVCEYGLENYCETVPGLAVDQGDGTYTITISSTFKYAFGLVTTKTQITTNIYAIPVFVPDVIKFTETDAFSTGAVSVSGNIVSIDYSKMNVSHYDILNQRLYQSDYVWDLPSLPAGATPENVLERETLLKAADWLQFVMIDSTQFEEMSGSIIGCDVKLDTMITEHNLDVISQESLTKDNQVLSFDMTGLTGEYYVFAFYYPIGTAANESKHIHRVSDNYVKIRVDAGSILDFEIVKNTMAHS